MSKELLQQALDALENISVKSANGLDRSDIERLAGTATALREAIAQPVQPAVTPFGRTYKDHLEQATRWLDSQKARLHHKDCSSHAPSASCSCGLYMCLTNVHAVINAINAIPPIAKPAQPEPITGNWIAAEDVQRMALQLDVAMNGKSGAASAPSLCDVVSQAVAKFYYLAQAEPLSDEKMLSILINIDATTSRLPPGFKELARAIEAAHGIIVTQRGPDERSA